MKRIIEYTMKYVIERIGKDVTQENAYNKMPMIKICIIKLANNIAHN